MSSARSVGECRVHATSVAPRPTPTFDEVVLELVPDASSGRMGAHQSCEANRGHMHSHTAQLRTGHHSGDAQYGPHRVSVLLVEALQPHVVVGRVE